MESKSQTKIGIPELKAPKERVWQTVSGGSADEFWKPAAEGDVVEGKLTGSFDGSFGKVYLIEHAGRTIGLPSNVMLQNLLLKVPLSSDVRITFGGSKLNERKQQFKVFKVEVASEAPPFY